MMSMPSHDAFFSAMADVPGEKGEPFKWNDYVKLATVTHDSGYVAVLLDGETQSIRVAFSFAYGTSSSPTNGSRVVCMKIGGQWVVICPYIYL